MRIRIDSRLANPPKTLFHLGSLDTDRPLMAIVGTRRSVRTDGEITHKLSFELAEADIGIVSDLALGVDATAHQGGIGGKRVHHSGHGRTRAYNSRKQPEG